MEELQMVIESITGTITMQEMVLEEMEARLESGLSLSEYSERCMEIEKQKGLIMGLKSAIMTTSFTKNICANKLKQAVSTPVAEEPITELVVEPLSSPAQRAFNGLMNQVKELPQYRKHSLMVVSQQPHYVQAEFKGISNPNWVTLDVIEKGDTIHYRLEKRMVNTDSYSALLDTDEELLAFNYIQKEIKRGSLQSFKGKDNYRKLLPELKQVRFSGEVDAVDLAVYTDRIDKLNESGELTHVQLDKLNRLMEELELNWGEQS